MKHSDMSRAGFRYWVTKMHHGEAYAETNRGSPLGVASTVPTVSDKIMERKLIYTAERVVRVVCRAYKVWQHDVIGKGRFTANIRPRRHIMWILYHERSDLGSHSVGQCVGGRDHATVLHALDRFGDAESGEGVSPTFYNKVNEMILEDYRYDQQKEAARAERNELEGASVN